MSIKDGDRRQDNNRRRDERSVFLDEIELEFSSGKRLVRISDISLGGCYVDSIITTAVGDAVAFAFTRSRDENIRFSGKVAFIMDGYGFGVRFGELSKDAKEFLDRVIKEQTKPE